MNFRELKTLVTVLLGAAVTSAYCIYAFGKYKAGTAALDSLQFWAVTMLVFIGIGIVLTIILQIVFHILMAIVLAVKEGGQDEKKIEERIKTEFAEDEMDRQIGRKSAQFGYAAAGIGFMAGLITLALNQPPAIMLNIAFLSFSAGSILEGLMNLYLYRRGLHHGE